MIDFVEPLCEDDQHLMVNVSFINAFSKYIPLDSIKIYTNESSIKYYKNFFNNVDRIENFKKSKGRISFFLSVNLSVLLKNLRGNNYFIFHALIERFCSKNTVKNIIFKILFYWILVLSKLFNNNFIVCGDHILINLNKIFLIRILKFKILNFIFDESLMYKHFKPRILKNYQNKSVVLGNYYTGKYILPKKKIILKNLFFYGKIHFGTKDLDFMTAENNYLDLRKYYEILFNSKAVIILNKSYKLSSSYVFLEALYLNKLIISYKNHQAISYHEKGMNIKIFENYNQLSEILDNLNFFQPNNDKFIKLNNENIDKQIKSIINVK